MSGLAVDDDGARQRGDQVVTTSTVFPHGEREIRAQLTEECGVNNEEERTKIVNEKSSPWRTSFGVISGRKLQLLRSSSSLLKRDGVGFKGLSGENEE